MPCGMMTRKKTEKLNFEANGGRGVLNRIVRIRSEIPSPIFFTSYELSKATNNYHESNFMGTRGTARIYKGRLLPDKRLVAIFKWTVGVRDRSDEFANSIVLLGMISHRNVVRLLGCCLETEMPLLVYEYGSNDTLYDHIHREGSALSLESRLRIAAEIATAIAYLHHSIHPEIILRDLKTANIQVDHNFTAKVSCDSGAMFIPQEIETSSLVRQNLGYLDPEYLHTNTITRESVVYSFGVVLVELLTKRVAFSFQKPVAERNLANFFMCLVEEGLLKQIIDDEILRDSNVEVVEKVADLARRCLQLRREERPSITEVEGELHELLRSIKFNRKE